jgi:hypothetical protein
VAVQEPPAPSDIKVIPRIQQSQESYRLVGLLALLDILFGMAIQYNKTKTRKAVCYADFCGAPERTRTSDLLIRSQTLYPAELRALIALIVYHRLFTGAILLFTFYIAFFWKRPLQ